MAQISIIIPVYNSELYLKDCIESILHQSYEDFEALFIDDGSQDASFSIISEFAHCDKRIRLYHQNNAGVSAARNLGLKYATGDYIAFIDSDDTIDRDYLAQLYQCAERYSPDIVLSGIINTTNKGHETNRVELQEDLWSLNTEENLIHLFTTPLLSSPALKLYKRHIIFDSNIRFDTSISCAEDRDFNLQYFMYVKNVCSLSYCGYYYRNVADSLAHGRYEYKFRVEHKHWHIKRKMFEMLGSSGVVGRSYLVNQLFYIISDEMSDIVLSAHSFDDILNQWEKSKSYIDFEYISKNYDLLNQPVWMKHLLRCKFYIIIFLILLLKKIL